MTRHFLTLTDLSRDELGYLIQRAIELKADHRARRPSIQFHAPSTFQRPPPQVSRPLIQAMKRRRLSSPSIPSRSFG